MKDSVPTAVPKKRKKKRRKHRLKEPTPTLRFSPFAWAKLLFLRDCGDTEVGGFGISAENDLLLIEDVRLIGQHTTLVSVQFDDEAVADYFDEQVDAGHELATGLNDRFAPWYYVISAADFQNIRLSREDLVIDKPAEDGD